MGYSIKDGYRINSAPRAYVDSVEESRIYQVQVYEQVARMAEAPEVCHVIDVGCGAGVKLVEIVAPRGVSVCGLDLPETIHGCRKRYPGHDWVEGDLSDSTLRSPGIFDLVVAADVIEHLEDPDCLLNFVRTACHHATRIVLSTPERDLRRGSDDMGPPGNPAHVREWNAAEFCEYLTSRSFLVEQSRIVELREGMRTCHLVIGRFVESAKCG